MLNKDLIKEQNKEIAQKFAAGLAKNDVEETAEALREYQKAIMESIEQEFQELKGEKDAEVLQSRGLRALTSQENAWYQKFIEHVQSGARQDAHGITNLTDAIPPTVIDRVIEDMKKDHPLLDAINFQNANGATKLILNGVQMSSLLGSWGAITSAITEEVTGQIKTIDVSSNKYTAYFLIPKDFVKFNFGFAPTWVDRYIRIILGEVIANGLEKTIIEGDGDGQFIGMERDLTSVTSGKYNKKSKTAISDFGSAYSDVIAGLIEDDNGDYRNVGEVLLIVNPKDYVRKVRAIQNAITHVGIIDLISHTWPTKTVPSAFVAENDAVVGIAKNYFAAINGGQSGIVEYSDEFKFLDDVRTYTTRMYGNGRPIDNRSFAYLDISEIATPALPVRVVDTVSTEEVTP